MNPWATSGGSLGYKPYVSVNMLTSYNPLPKLLQHRSDVASNTFAANMSADANRLESLRTTLPAAYRLLDFVTASSSTINERDRKLRAALESISPGATDRSYLKAKQLLQSGRVLTDRDAMAVAVAEELPSGFSSSSGGSSLLPIAIVIGIAILVLR